MRRWPARLFGCWVAGLWACSPAPRPALWLFYDTAQTNVAELRLAVRASGGEVRTESSWLNAVSASIAPGRARRIDGVVHVQPVRKMFAAAVPAAHAPGRPMAQQDSTAYGPNFRALRELGIPAAHQLGFTGRGVRIAILDTGFETAHQAFTAVQVMAQRDFINNDDNVATEPGDPIGRDQEIHGTWVWSLLGGNRAGQVIGPAHAASYLLAKVNVDQAGEDLAADEDRWVAAVQWADSMGARIISSSLVFRDFLDKSDYTPAQLNGDIAISARIADEAARRGILIVTAMGNLGPAASTLGAPADGDSVLSVGAVDSLRNVLAESSRGPTGDGRPKPEVYARGVNLYVAASSAIGLYEYASRGTSFSTPLVAGAAAQFMQAWPNLSVMAVHRALTLAGPVPNVASAIVFPDGILTAGVASADQNGFLTTIAPTFNWTVPLVLPSARPTYRLELATDTGFANIIYSDTVTNALSLMVRRPITPITPIYWRVTGETLSPSIRRSSARAGPFRMPDWVLLTVLNSVSGEVVNSTRPTLRWDPLAAPPPAGPLSYDVEVLSEASRTVVQRARNLNTASWTVAEPLTPNLSYRWRVIARSPLGVVDTVESRGVFLVTSVESPPATLLYPPFPNPFPRAGETRTRLWFDISEDSAFVELGIYDLRGRLIKQLIPSETGCGRVRLDSGQFGRSPVTTDPCQLTTWDGTNSRGETVPHGVYIARLRVAGRVQTQRILFSPRE